MKRYTDSSKQHKIKYIYESCYAVMAYTAGKYLSDAADVEDAVHNAFLSIIVKIDMIDTSDESRLKSLCCLIAKNKAVDIHRRHDKWTQPEGEWEEELLDDRSEPAEIIAGEQAHEIIARTIKGLSDTYRDVCTLKYLDGFKEWEIARLLDLPPKTVNLRIMRGKQLIRDTLRKEGIHE